jgi:hypothetical protein
LLDGWWHEQLDAAWAKTCARFEAGEAHVLGASLHRGKEALESCPQESDTAAQALRPFPLRRPAAGFEGQAP